MALGRCGKLLLIIFNLILAGMGITLLSLGLWLRFSTITIGFFDEPDEPDLDEPDSDEPDLDEFDLDEPDLDEFDLDEPDLDAIVHGVRVLLVLGTVMLVLAAFGNYVAFSKNQRAQQVFSVLLGLLSVAKVVVGVLVCVYFDQIVDQIKEFYTITYDVYLQKEGRATGFLLKLIRNMLHCCGVEGKDLATNICPETDTVSLPNCHGVIVDELYNKEAAIKGVFFGHGALLMAALACFRIFLRLIKRT